MGATVSKTYELLENLYYYEEEELDEGLFLGLPSNILSRIVSHLPGSEAIRATGVSKRWKENLENDQALWEELFLRDFGREALVWSSGKSWKEAYFLEYKKKVKIFKENTEKIARIMGFEEFDSSSKESYNDLVAFMEKKLNTNIVALREAGVEA